MKFAISTLMYKHNHGNVSNTHHLCVVEGVSREECLGKAMLHAFAANPGYMIVGATTECVEEPAPTYELAVAWGSFNDDGSWWSNDRIGLSVDEQRQQNIKNGHLCAGCDHAPSRCVCSKEGRV